MGVSTDAILAYGYTLDDDLADPEEDEFGESEDYADALGRKLLSRLVGYNEEWHAYVDDKFYDRKRAAEAKLKVEVVGHCSCDYPMYFLAAKGSVTMASRGYPEVIEFFDPQPDWDANLKEAMTALGKTTDKKPAWHLFSMWC